MSVTLWRIAQETPRYRAEDVSGAGAAMYGGRWNSKGRAIVYSSTTIALAYLESLAHLGGEIPRSRFLIRITVLGDVWKRARRASAKSLPAAWRAESAGISARQFGDRWIDAGRQALLILPSILIPEELNALINPIHRDAERLVVKTARQLLYDPRLLRV